jgi:CPA1 family monovalent cation:H+ antiporter
MALAVPARTATGSPFPGRELIVSVALGVIFATIVVQGLTLRPLIKWLSLPRDVAVGAEERQARLGAEHAALARLTQLVDREQLPADVEAFLRTMIKQRTRLDLDDIDHATGHDGRTSADVLRRATQEVLDASRAAVVRLRDEDVIGDEAMRRVMSDLDLDDLRMAEAPAM